MDKGFISLNLENSNFILNEFYVQVSASKAVFECGRYQVINTINKVYKLFSQKIALTRPFGYNVPDEIFDVLPGWIY
jgi:hypothetical protein